MQEILGRLAEIFAPRTTVVNTIVTSYTNFPHLRLDIDFTVAVDEDLDRVRAELVDLARGDDDLMDEPSPKMFVDTLNDYNTAVQWRVWLDDEGDHIAKRAQLREAAFKRLNEAGVEMPYETFEVHGPTEAPA